MNPPQLRQRIQRGSYTRHPLPSSGTEHTRRNILPRHVSTIYIQTPPPRGQNRTRAGRQTADKAHKPTPPHGAILPRTQYITAWALLNERKQTPLTEEERNAKYTLEKHLSNIPHRYRNLAAPYLYYLVRKGCYDIAEGKIHDLRPDQHGNVDHQEQHDYTRLQRIIQDLIRHHRYMDKHGRLNH
jgi:hypothetical protein